MKRMRVLTAILPCMLDKEFQCIIPVSYTHLPYSSARDEYNGAEASVFLDAHENPYNTPNNRYPDPMQRELKNMIAPIKKVDPDTIDVYKRQAYRLLVKSVKTDMFMWIRPTLSTSR